MASNCIFRVPLEEFEKLNPAEQSRLIYGCLLDLQERVTWKWKILFSASIIAGCVGGFFHDLLIGRM